MTKEFEQGSDSEGLVKQEQKQERILCGSYEEFVRSLGLAMEPDVSKIFPKDKFDYTDLESWIGAVGFVDEKVPNIEVNIPAKGKQNAVKFSIRDLEAIPDAETKVSPEMLMYAAALAEAKLYRLENKKMQFDDGEKVTLLEIVDDVYPAIQAQIQEAHKTIKAMRKEILGDEEKKSLIGVLKKLESKKGYRKIVNAAVISGIVLSACQATATPTEEVIPRGTQWGVPTVTETVTVEPVVTETVTPIPTETEIPVSKDFAERYPAEWGESYMAQVGGMDIPIYFGLTENVVNPIDKPGEEKLIQIKEVHINGQEVVDATASYFLRSCHYRYIHTEGNEEISYEDYLKLVAGGGGEIELAVVNTEPGVSQRSLAMIKPNQGFSMVWTNDKKMPVFYNYNFGIYLGVDDFGRVLMAINRLKFISSFTGYFGDSGFTSTQLTVLFSTLASVDNKCMSRGNILDACGNIESFAPDPLEILELINRNPDLQLFSLEH